MSIASAQARSEAPPRTLWNQAGLAASLALVSGYVDAYSYLSYKVYASFMSGNTTQSGLRIGEGEFTTVAPHLLPIGAFVLGGFGGTWLLHGRISQPERWLFAACAALLLVSLAVTLAGASPQWFNVTLLATAMGAMNTTVTHVGKLSVGLGYVSGTLNSIGQHLALAVRRVPVPHAQGAWDTNLRRAGLLSSVCFAFLFGALSGAAAKGRFDWWALLPPIIYLLALAAFDRAKSISA